MANEHAGRMQAFESARSAHRAALTKIESTGTPNQQADELFLNKGVYGDIRPPELSLLVDGLSRSLPSQVHTAQFNARKVDEAFYDNPVLALFASPDLGYIVNIVVSLLALLFVFDAICGEKERGTLKIALANSVPRDLVILGKWIGGYVSLAAPFIAALLTGVAYVHLTGALVIDGDVLGRLLWLFVVSLVYVSLFFTLGLMISTLTHRASTALIVSLFVWICWILVIPNLAPVIARIAYPVPSPEKIAAEKLAIDQETDLRVQRISQSRLSYGREARRLQEEMRQEGERRKDKLDRFYRDAFRDQTEASKTLSRISPAASYRYATTELAGTGTHLFDGFKQAYERFESDFEEYADGVNSQRGDQGQLPAGWYQPDQVPGFEMTRDRVDDAWNRIAIDLLLLGMFNVLFFISAYMFFLRYDVT
jgi:ABC-type transport system involved in multi-copper enzyme maturation permease subunit